MIKLKPISKKDEKDFLDDIKKRYVEWCVTNKTNKSYQPLFNYLLNGATFPNFDPSRLENIIVGNRIILRDIIKSVGKITADGSMINLYNNFIARKLGKEWGIRTGAVACPYCNRNYIFTASNKAKSIRPQYDHFFPKSLYPYLCVSMYNLIPSCPSCNVLKQSYDTYSNDFIYPYEEEYGYDTVFDITYKDVTDLIDGSKPLSVIIKNRASNLPLPSSIINSKNQLLLEPLYNKHQDYIKSILMLSRIYTEKYIKGLKKDYAWLKAVSDESLKDVLFLSKLNKEDWGKCTMSKITADLLNKYY